jgi:hypothetical protein
MVNNRSTRKARASLMLASASEAVGSAVGRAVGRVERMVKIARQRMAGQPRMAGKRTKTSRGSARPRKRAR